MADELDEPPTDSQMIDQLVLTWLNAVASGDADGLAGLVTLEARIFPPSGPPVAGPQGIAGHYRGIFDEYDVVQTSHPDEISIVGDTAIVLSADRMELKPRDGRRRRILSGRSLRILRCGLDGRWLIHRAIDNLAPARRARPGGKRAG